MNVLVTGGSGHLGANPALAPNYPLRFTEGAVRMLSMCRRADTTKARTKLGFVPTRIEDGSQETRA